MHPSIKSTLLALGFLALLVSCSDTASDEAAGPGASAGGDGETPVVYVTNGPLHYFATRIAGDDADVRFPEIDGDPAFWEPTEEQVAAMQQADLILMNGATYEKWASTATLPTNRTVDTSEAFKGDLIETRDTTTHSHGAAGEHSHSGTAFTTWMDLDLARQQAEAVRDALAEAMPDHAEAVKTNAAGLIAELKSLDESFMEIGKQIGDRPLVASHPIYQYFAERYGLNVKPVLWEPEVVPDDAAMSDLRAVLADHPATLMIWEGEPAEESVEKLNAIGVDSVVVDPSGNRPDDGDWMAVMKQNVENLRAVADGSAG